MIWGQVAVLVGGLAAGLLAWSGVRALRRPGESRQKAWLMIALSVIILANIVLIAALPGG